MELELNLIFLTQFHRILINNFDLKFSVLNIDFPSIYIDKFKIIQDTNEQL